MERNEDGEGEKRQETVTIESQTDVSINGFWKRGTSNIFDIKIVNLDTGFYLRQTSAKVLETAEKEKKDNYLQPCLESRTFLTPMVYSMDGFPGTEDVAEHQRLA